MICDRTSRSRRPQRLGCPRGSGCPNAFVLLVVIAVLVLLVTALSMFAQASLRRGLAASDAHRRLQVTWGQRSLRQTVLARAAEVFDAREERYFEQLKQSGAAQPPSLPRPSIRDAITLNGVTFDLMLGDEDSKVDLNLIYHHGGADKVNQWLRDFLGATSAAVALRPGVDPGKIEREQKKQTFRDESEDEDQQAPPPVRRAFRGWGEVFDLGRLESITGSPDSLPPLTAEMTIAGTGQINLSRATDEAVRTTGQSVLGDGGSQRLLLRYRSNPTIAAESLLQVEVSNEQNREQLASLIQQSGESYSLWIDVSTTGGHRRRQWVTSRSSEDGSRRIERFAF